MLNYIMKILQKNKNKIKSKKWSRLRLKWSQINKR
jgi:hypothetical protein